MNKKQTWYYVFHPSYGGHTWWMKLFTMFTDKKFGHVEAFTQCGPWVATVRHKKNYNEFVVEYLEADPSEPIPASMYAEIWATKPNAVVIKHEHVPKVRGWRSFINIVPNCVSLVKLMTGIHSLSCTPLQLHNYLLKSGGEYIPNKQETL